MGAALQYVNSYRSLSCGQCGIVFHVPVAWYEARAVQKENGGAFYCPNGHTRIFRKTDVDQLRAQLADANRRVEWERGRAANAEKRIATAKAETTRLRNRIAAGVCPDCHRSFQNLKRHVATKHGKTDVAAS